ncbi:MAG: hypothetical protein GX485_06665 [Clostridiales bacterium]|nr:hypothetical protein [Clostridiales bacterium]
MEQGVFSSHHPKAILPAAVETSSETDMKTRNDPPGGKISLPFSVSTTVVPGSPLRTNALNPPVGSPDTLDAACNWTRGFGTGRIAVLDGVTGTDSNGPLGEAALNQNWARKGESDISVTVQRLTIN